MIEKLKNSLVFKNTLSMIGGNGVRTVVQALYFILIAKSLGAEGYGSFLGATAYVAILSPFAGWGSGNILVRNISRKPEEFPIYWGACLQTTFITGLIFAFIAIACAGFFMPKNIPLSMVVMVAFADLVFIRFVDISGQAFQGFQKMKKTALFNASISTSRLIMVALFSFTNMPKTAEVWTFLYLISAFACMLWSLTLTTRDLGMPTFKLKNNGFKFREGFFFAMGLSAQTIYNDLDKTMLSKMSTLQAVGIYGAAYRIIDVAFTPVRSLLGATYARFFSEGQNGIGACMNIVKKYCPLAVIYGLVTALALYYLAPFLPYFLGENFKDSVDAIRWICLIPAIRSVHYFAADTLSGTGRQALRSFVQVMIAGINVLLNLWLIPSYSWVGAAIASIASDSLLAIALWSLVLFWWSKEKQQSFTEEKLPKVLDSNKELTNNIV